MADKTTNEPGWLYKTTQRAYYEYPGCFVKRSLRPSEYWIVGEGESIVPTLGVERLQNEAATLQFVREKTNIPVPMVYGAMMIDDVYFLVTEKMVGVTLYELPEDQKELVWPEIEQHLATLHDIKSTVLGGPSGLVIPPYRALFVTKGAVLSQQKIDTPDYVFCHNDLSQHNIIVDLDTLKVVAILQGWTGNTRAFSRHTLRALSIKEVVHRGRWKGRWTISINC
ncbi:hypothetical protein N7456_012816 [Penicillium angulare]|uniref:Aminoglycoside phosphotransferase domain-containing protein n=1 Tax=Penicillium angulare TaxID=116970 RepID=A0A9W9EKE8_9EURO|nr:hypothetical protein N7456_012816 [Penicillium angulare]